MIERTVPQEKTRSWKPVLIKAGVVFAVGGAILGWPEAMAVGITLFGIGLVQNGNKGK